MADQALKVTLIQVKSGVLRTHSEVSVLRKHFLDVVTFRGWTALVDH